MRKQGTKRKLKNELVDNSLTGPFTVAVSPNEKFIAIGYDHKNYIAIFDNKGNFLSKIEIRSSSVKKLVFSKDSQSIIIFYSDTRIIQIPNLLQDWEDGDLWNKVYKLNKEEQKKYLIDWDY